MPSFPAWSDEVLLRQCAESNALLSLSRPAVGDALDSHDQGIDGRCVVAMMMLASEIDDVFLRYGMVWRATLSFLCWSMCLIPLNKISTDHAGTMSAVVKLSEETDDAAPLAFDVSPRWKCART